jgi:hypothetical protein
VLILPNPPLKPMHSQNSQPSTANLHHSYFRSKLARCHSAMKT